MKGESWEYYRALQGGGGLGEFNRDTTEILWPRAIKNFRSFSSVQRLSGKEKYI